MPMTIDCPECKEWIETYACPECGNTGTLYNDTLAENYRVCSNSNCKQEYYTDTNYGQCSNCNDGKITVYSQADMKKARDALQLVIDEEGVLFEGEIVDEIIPALEAIS